MDRKQCSHGDPVESEATTLEEGFKELIESMTCPVHNPKGFSPTAIACLRQAFYVGALLHRSLTTTITVEALKGLTSGKPIDILRLAERCKKIEQEVDDYFEEDELRSKGIQ